MFLQQFFLCPDNASRKNLGIDQLRRRLTLASCRLEKFGFVHRIALAQLILATANFEYNTDFHAKYVDFDSTHVGLFNHGKSPQLNFLIVLFPFPGSFLYR